MSLDGIWKVEILGVYDWEALTTAFLHDGRYWAGSADHYTVGSYDVDGDKVISNVTTVLHGKSRTLFGKNVARHKIRFEGEVSNDTIKGTATNDEGKFVVQFRATKLADLP